MLKVNLGSGYIGLDDWVNIDNSMLARFSKWHLIHLLVRLRIIPHKPWGYVKWPRKILVRDLRRPFPFRDSSVDFVYTSHTLEHFKRYECLSILKETHRVMKEGGTIRVVVPDVELIANKYLQRDKKFFLEGMEHKPDRLLADMFLDIFFMDQNYSKRGLKGNILTRFTSLHRWMYDFDSMSAILSEAGFSKISRQRYREGRVPDLEKLDLLPQYSMYVEAEKT